MKNKKSEKANLENKRGMLFMFGLVISLSTVLLAFEWKTQPKQIKVQEQQTDFASEDVYIPPKTKEKIELPKPKIEIQSIDIVGNDELVDAPFEFASSEIVDPVLDFTNLVNSFPKEKDKADETIFIFPEQMPEFPGGELALRKYIANAIKYPVIAQENGVDGKVFVSFVINEKGGIEDVALARGIDPALNNEALRVIRSLPNWKPGKQGGKAVKVRYTVPIVFELR